jgi:hypothetical protein
VREGSMETFFWETCSPPLAGFPYRLGQTPSCIDRAEQACSPPTGLCQPPPIT